MRMVPADPAAWAAAAEAAARAARPMTEADKRTEDAEERARYLAARHDHDHEWATR